MDPQDKIISKLHNLALWMWKFEEENGLEKSIEISRFLDPEGICFTLTSLVIAANFISEDIKIKKLSNEKVDENADNLENLLARLESIESDIPQNNDTDSNDQNLKLYQKAQILFLQLMQCEYNHENFPERGQDIVRSVNNLLPQSFAKNIYHSKYYINKESDLIELTSNLKAGEALKVSTERHTMLIFTYEDENGILKHKFYDPNLGSFIILQEGLLYDPEGSNEKYLVGTSPENMTNNLWTWINDYSTNHDVVTCQHFATEGRKLRNKYPELKELPQLAILALIEGEILDNNLEAVLSLLSFLEDINLKNKDGNTLLDGIVFVFPKLIEEFLARGAKLNTDSDGWTTFHQAACVNSAQTLEMLAKHFGIDKIEAKDNEGFTPLARAGEHNNLAVINWFLEKIAINDDLALSGAAGLTDEELAEILPGS